ncbi:MAG: retropepsin-like aspartic protease [Bacteroidales bacterium]
MIKIPLAVIPIDENGYHLMARGNINGLTTNILVDTGASRTVLDLRRTAHYFDDTPLRSFEKYFTGVGAEKMETQAVIIPQLNIGAFEVRGLEVLVIDLEGVNKSYAALDLPRIDMVMGGDLLVHCAGIIDYPNKELIFRRAF